MTEDRGVTRWPLLLAALLVVAGGLAMFFVTRPRAPVQTIDASQARARAGAGVLEGADARFTWSREPRADVYRIEVYDRSAHLLAAAVLRDTSVLASALLPDTARAGIWRVVPVSVGGTELPPTGHQRFIRP